MENPWILGIVVAAYIIISVARLSGNFERGRQHLGVFEICLKNGKQLENRTKELINFKRSTRGQRRKGL